MKKRVLDIGGRKIGKRGSFRPPIDDVTSWEYINIDPSTDPDYCCDAKEIPIPDESIDTVIMTELLEYLSEPRKVLLEISRLLKKGGHVLISTPLMNPVHGDYWADRARYTPVMLSEMSSETGFEIKKIEPMGSVGAVVYDTLRVATGYADESGELRRFSSLLLKSRRIFRWIEKKTGQQKKYINTGYFVVLAK
jgi:ubiquinone/menaquinone biosynthesis C-methylase UbiE